MSQTGYAAYSLSIPIHRTHRDTMHMIKYSLHVCDEQGKVLALKKSHIFFRSVEDEAQSADQNNRIQLSICNKEGGVAKRKPTGNTKKSTLFFGHQHDAASYGSEEDDSSEEDEDDEDYEDEDANEGADGEGADEDGEGADEDGEGADEDGEGADEDGEGADEDGDNEELEGMEGACGEAEDTILHNMYVSACKEPLSNDEAAEHIGCLPDEE